MKAVISISILTAFLVAASPATQPKKPVDWSKVSSKLDEIVKVVTEAGMKVISNAKKDNETIGVEIEKIIETEGKQLETTLKKVRNDISSKSLTMTKVSQYVDLLNLSNTGVSMMTAYHLVKLSKSAQTGIWKFMDTTTKQVDKLAKEFGEFFQD